MGPWREWTCRAATCRAQPRSGADLVQGVAPAQGVADPAALAAAVERLGDPRILLVDVKAETEGVLAAYARATLLWALVGGTLVLGLLALGLGGVGRALHVAGPIGGGPLVTPPPPGG